LEVGGYWSLITVRTSTITDNRRKLTFHELGTFFMFLAYLIWKDIGSFPVSQKPTTNGKTILILFSFKGIPYHFGFGEELVYNRPDESV